MTKTLAYRYLAPLALLVVYGCAQGGHASSIKGPATGGSAHVNTEVKPNISVTGQGAASTTENVVHQKQ